MNSYVIVRVPTVDGLSDLTAQVNTLIGQGYEPLGAPMASGQSIIQALYVPVAKPYMEVKSYAEPVVSVAVDKDVVIKGVGFDGAPKVINQDTVKKRGPKKVQE